MELPTLLCRFGGVQAKYDIRLASRLVSIWISLNPLQTNKEGSIAGKVRGTLEVCNSSWR